MWEGAINPDLVQEIRSGHATRERKLAIASGSASLSPEERVDLLAMLAEDADELVAERAASALLTQPVESFLAALNRPNFSGACSRQLVVYCAKNLLDKPGIAEALARRPECPGELLAPAVPRLGAAAVQALLEDLDRLSTAPALAAALAASTSLTAEQRQQLQELQQDAPASLAELEEAAAVAESDRTKRQTLLQRLSRMRVVERVQLALKGNREERMTLIRDPCKVVQRAVLQSTRITDREVEAFAAMASLSDEVLRLIGKNRNFIKNYTVVKNLMSNPKAPLDISLHMLPTLTAQDLKLLTSNKNIPETLRTMAIRLQRQRKEVRQGS